MPELEVANAGDLAALLKENGYALGGESPNMEMLAKLPRKVQARVAALKGVQKKSIEVEAEFYKKVHALEKEFQSKFEAVFEERRKIVSGDVEPKEEDCKLPLIHGMPEEEIAETFKETVEDKGEKGIPDFWLHVLKSESQVSEMIQEHDEPILRYLLDITTTVELEPAGFSLFFHFGENPYFKNKVLSKKYLLNMLPEEEDFFDYDGPNVTKSEGTKVEWNDGKDITKKVVKKKQKKGANAGKFLTKTIKADSFFNFFDPPQEPSADQNEEDEDEESAELLRADFEMGQILRDNVIPRAVLFFTGEAVEGDYFDDDFEDGDDEDDEDDDEDEE